MRATRSGVVTVLALALLVPGVGAVAQSPSPEATPLYAPDDLATTLPTTVGDYEVRIVTGALPPTYREVYRDMLLPFGRTPDDVLVADGMGYPTGDEDALDRDGPSFDLWAMRVEGIPAAALVEPWVFGAFAASDAFDESLWQMGWRDIGGHDVYAATPIPKWWDEAVAREGANPEFGWYLLAKGEVMFIVSLPVSHAVSSPTLVELLAELP